MEENKNIELSLGHVSLNQELNIYYIDLRNSIIHYTHNIWGGGFDEYGVPYCRMKQDQIIYNPVNIAQYGLIIHAKYISDKNEKDYEILSKCVEKLIDLAEINENYCIWWYKNFEEKYQIPSPWASAMAQGEAISLFLRYYQMCDDEIYLELSEKAYNFLKVPVSQNGVRQIDLNGNLWLEEYPSNPASFVLNGFIYAIFGLFDLYRVTKKDEIKTDIDACISTLKNNLQKFDAGYWSYYDLLKKELVRYYYQKNVHIPQLEALYLLTNEPIFDKFKNKWEKTLNPINYSFVKIMYRVLPRWRNKKIFLK